MPSYWSPSWAKWWRSHTTTHATGHSDCSWVVQHPLSLGPGGHVQPDPIVPAQPAQSVDSAVQLDPSQESVKHDSSCLTSRASAIKDQGFSAALAARIKAPE